MSRSENNESGRTGSEDKVVSLPSAEKIEVEAAQWLTVLGRESLSDVDKGKFKRWLQASQRHRDAFKETAGLWGDMEMLKELDDIAEAVLEVTPAGSHAFSRRTITAIAASIAAAVMAGGIYLAYDSQFLDQEAMFATTVGEQRSVRLSDGSMLQLNTDSRAEVAFSRAERVVRLVNGEAHFDVVSDKKRPFLVYAPRGLVEAVGTAFTVRVHSDDAVEVTVEEGRVALASLAPISPRSEGAISEPVDRALLAQLTAGQSAIFRENVKKIEQLPEPALKRKLAWRQGMLAFSGETLAEVIEDIGRYTDVTIEIADPVLRNELVEGYFRVGETEALFDSLELSFGVEVERIDDKHVRLVSGS